jgi:hypothetical protein
MCFGRIPMSQRGRRGSAISSLLTSSKITHRDTGPNSNSSQHSIPSLYRQTLLFLPSSNLPTSREQLFNNKRNGESSAKWPSDDSTKSEKDSSLVSSRRTSGGRSGRVEPKGVGE